ncbi:hypothetical protein MCOR25_009106 [Pyricularia grisea]|uniref:Uncharacterized protein n=1 Tax=Pyricularia grisea TaxID=148305 RepID=A0A6P8ANQ5_PYRGI|nr:uncharacterized protein PgNI_11858 [Pyricularia grisea]KAI6353209.1 hypothetical protein MCOR25_009106 [Pyricularia grisea]TLD03651.1 hypothetical protein PgNI_11858 [Pyricularia grisea]
MESFGPVVFTGTETLHQPDGSDPPPKFVRLTEEQRQRVRTLRRDAYMTFAEIHAVTGFSETQIRRAINGPSRPPRRMGRPPKTPEQRVADKAAREAAKAAELARLAEESFAEQEQAECQDGAFPQRSPPLQTVTPDARPETPDLAAVARHVRDPISIQRSSAYPEARAPAAVEKQQDQGTLANPMEIDDEESPPPQTPSVAPILPETSQTITPAIQTQTPIPAPSHPAPTITNASPQYPTQSTQSQGPISVPPSPAQTTDDPAIVSPEVAQGSDIPGPIGNRPIGAFALPFPQAQQHLPPPRQRKKIFIVWCEMARSFGRNKPPTAMIGVYSTRNFANEHGCRVIRQYCLNGKCKVPQPKWWVEERDLLEEGDPGIYWPSC